MGKQTNNATMPCTPPCFLSIFMSYIFVMMFCHCDSRALKIISVRFQPSTEPLRKAQIKRPKRRLTKPPKPVILFRKLVVCEEAILLGDTLQLGAVGSRGT